MHALIQGTHGYNTFLNDTLILTIIYQLIQKLKSKLFFFRIRSLGTAALTLCYVAMGAVEAYHIESIDAWDVAAGKLIIEEAGGVVIDTAGEY